MIERRRGKVMRLAIPSKGSLSEPTHEYFKRAGLALSRPNARRYTGKMSGQEDIEVLYQRATEIPEKIIEGTVDLGVTGLDIIREDFDRPEIIVLMENLGYGRADLVLAVPDAWVDVQSISDLADLSWEWKSRGREVRIATKFKRLTSRFLAEHGINYFQLVASHGATEVAPEMGLADCIVDLTSSGATLRDNHLKPVTGGRVFRSQACLIASRDALARAERLRERTRMILEMCEAVERARGVYVLSVRVGRDDARAFSDELERALPGRARVDFQETALDPKSIAAQIQVPRAEMYEALAVCRKFSDRAVTANKVDYVFEPVSPAWRSLLHQLKE
ncbi:MAG: ATP phosphoribosyltransferase [Myxococcales bacterium]|nr:ATP phosphoribosyltransferase [Myxococcales bacterium]